jgi:hypothetical protein
MTCVGGAEHDKACPEDTSPFPRFSQQTGTTSSCEALSSTAKKGSTLGDAWNIK